MCSGVRRRDALGCGPGAELCLPLPAPWETLQTGQNGTFFAVEASEPSLAQRSRRPWLAREKRVVGGVFHLIISAREQWFSLGGDLASRRHLTMCRGIFVVTSGGEGGLLASNSKTLGCR